MLLYSTLILPNLNVIKLFATISFMILLSKDFDLYIKFSSFTSFCQFQDASLMKPCGLQLTCPAKKVLAIKSYLKIVLHCSKKSIHFIHVYSNKGQNIHIIKNKFYSKSPTIIHHSIIHAKQRYLSLLILKSFVQFHL